MPTNTLETISDASQSAETVTEQLYEIFPIGVPLIMNVLSLLFCMLQAMVFTMLLSIYVSEAAEEE